MKTEPSLFDIEIAVARVERDIALALVEDAAPTDWIVLAEAWLESFLRSHSEYFPDWDNLDAPQPPERRAWGPLIMRAKRSGWIADTGTTRQRTQGHGTPGRVWKSLIFQEGQ